MFQDEICGQSRSRQAIWIGADGGGSAFREMAAGYHDDVESATQAERSTRQ